jgi:heme ABC exporter ATP-binding subunit CcmA
MTTETAIRVSGLRKAYATSLVLDDVTFEVQAGEAVALLGANGAGKTTLLKILGTLVRPTRGEARVAGLDCVRDAEGVRRLVGVLGHGNFVYEDLTAFENLKFWTMLAGEPGDPATLHAALAQVDLDRVNGERVRTFSAGMKRRLALARLALRRPRVLLLDEPFASLDRGAGKWLDEYLHAFKAAGGAILMSTHSFGRGLGVADRAAILAGGRIVLDTPVAALGADDVRRLYDLHADDGA